MREILNISAAAFFFTSAAFAQGAAAGDKSRPVPVENDARTQQIEATLKDDPAQLQMFQLGQAIANAGTKEERVRLDAQMRDIQSKRAAQDEAKLTPERRKGLRAPLKSAPVGDADRDKQIEATMKGDPAQLQMFRLGRAIANASSREERARLDAKMRDLQSKCAARDEAKLTPELRKALLAPRKSAPVPVNDADRDKQIEATMKDDPAQLQMFRLGRAIANASSRAERARLDAKMRDLQSKHAAQDEEKLKLKRKSAPQTLSKGEARPEAEPEPPSGKSQ